MIWPSPLSRNSKRLNKSWYSNLSKKNREPASLFSTVLGGKTFNCSGQRWSGRWIWKNLQFFPFMLCEKPQFFPLMLCARALDHLASAVSMRLVSSWPPACPACSPSCPESSFGVFSAFRPAPRLARRSSAVVWLLSAPLLKVKNF